MSVQFNVPPPPPPPKPRREATEGERQAIDWCCNYYHPWLQELWKKLAFYHSLLFSPASPLTLDANDHLTVADGVFVRHDIGHAKGDLLVFSTLTNQFERFPVGMDGKVLTADHMAGLGVKWATGAAPPPTGVPQWDWSDKNNSQHWAVGTWD